MRKIACQNLKGGTGKTTTVISLASCLAGKGKKVLVLDVDVQGNIKVSFGIDHKLTMYDLLINDTFWIGYGELAKETGISLKTVQRAVDRLINTSLIKRIDLTNTAEIKGSQYQVILPEGMSTVDKKTTVDKMSTVVNEPKTDVEF